MKKKIYKPDHEAPNDFRWDYILLPYGAYYKTAEFLTARPGDTMRFFNGPDVEIQATHLIDGMDLCNTLSRMRYGIPWVAAFSRWASYAVMEGNGKDVLSPDKCIMVAYK